MQEQKNHKPLETKRRYLNGLLVESSNRVGTILDKKNKEIGKLLCDDDTLYFEVEDSHHQKIGVGIDLKTLKPFSEVRLNELKSKGAMS